MLTKPISKPCTRRLEAAARGAFFPLDQKFIRRYCGSARTRRGASERPARHRPRSGLLRLAETCETLQERGFSATSSAARCATCCSDCAQGLRLATMRPRGRSQVFRRSRLIGRRFKLVHVLFGEETSSLHLPRSRRLRDRRARARPARQHLRHSRDDTIRRDFTINALYYDPTPRPFSTTTTACAICGQVGAHHRRRARALSRGSDPDAARGALRGETGFDIEERTRRPIRELAP